MILQSGVNQTTKMRGLLIILAFATVALSEKATFENYKVFRVTPNIDKHIDLLQNFEDVSDDYMFWIGPTVKNRTVDIMVAPSKIKEFSNFISENNMPYEVYINDVQELINKENPTNLVRSGFDFKSYHTLDTMHEHLGILAERYASNLQLIEAGKSYENRKIMGVKFSTGGTPKPGIFIEGGVHAREWISPATVMFILDQFLTSQDPEIKSLAQSYDWYMVPSVNPDGYVYTHNKFRLWRKTRKPYGVCVGADANRNWGYKWMQGGASANPCAETYAGSNAFSEIEMKTVSDYLLSLKGKIFAYISFHSYSQLLMFPYGHTTAHLENYKELYAIGRSAISALSKRYGTEYETGNIAETIYIASGSSCDWAKGVLGLPVSYTYELRDTGRYGFLLPASQIVANGEEVMDSFVALFKEARKYGYGTS